MVTITSYQRNVCVEMLIVDKFDITQLLTIVFNDYLTVGSVKSKGGSLKQVFHMQQPNPHLSSTSTVSVTQKYKFI